MLELTLMLSNLFNITYLISTYGYFGIFIVVFLESGIFFALPGDSLLFSVGVFASSGILNIFILIPLIFVSTFLGGMFGYYVGMNIERLLHYPFFKKILKDEYVKKAHVFFEKHGKYAIIFSRFVPVVRTFMPIVAGIVKMKYSLFIRYSFVSSLLWSTTVTLLGYFLGNTFPWIKDYMPIFILLVIILSIIPVLIEILRKRRS